MNPLTPAAAKRRVEEEVRRIREAWPVAMTTWTHSRLSAVIVIRDPLSTYIIEVLAGEAEAVTRSLWVSHHEPIREGYVPEWQEGWVD